MSSKLSGEQLVEPLQQRFNTLHSFKQKASRRRIFFVDFLRLAVDGHSAITNLPLTLLYAYAREKIFNLAVVPVASVICGEARWLEVISKKKRVRSFDSSLKAPVSLPSCYWRDRRDIRCCHGSHSRNRERKSSAAAEKT